MVCSRDVCRLSMDLYCRRLTCAGRFHCAARSLNCRDEARRKGEGEGNRVRSRARSSWIILQIYSSSTFSLSRPYTEDGGRGRRRPKESRKKRGETECSVYVHVRSLKGRMHSGLAGVTFLPVHTDRGQRVCTRSHRGAARHVWNRRTFLDSRKHPRIYFIRGCVGRFTTDGMEVEGKTPEEPRH